MMYPYKCFWTIKSQFEKQYTLASNVSVIDNIKAHYQAAACTNKQYMLAFTDI